MKNYVRILSESKLKKVITFFNILACGKYIFISWWNITPFNKYVIAGILLVLGGLILVLGEKLFNVIAALIVAVFGALFVRSMVSPICPVCYMDNIWGNLFD